ncbi:MAG: recombinase family protein [Clostridiales bacterium]|nr:recombinase family protein [Clostridiales bacterium]
MLAVEIRPRKKKKTRATVQMKLQEVKAEKPSAKEKQASTGKQNLDGISQQILKPEQKPKLKPDSKPERQKEVTTTASKGKPKVTVTEAVSPTAEDTVTRIAAYCRVSTDLDAQETSIEAQKEAYAVLAESTPDWELVGIYADEGISGTQMRKRDAFLRMMQDCRDGKIDRVITKSISRFARNTLDCLSCVRELKDIGVPVYFEAERLDTGAESSELILAFMAAMAQEASREISNNEKWSQAKRFEEGIVKWSNVYGYRKEGGIQFIPVPEEAAVVVRIFEDYIHGKKSAEIARELEAEGFPTPKGGHWQYSTVDFILTNEKYCGDALCQKSYVTDHLSHRRRRNTSQALPTYYIHNHHTPIVDRDTYDMVQDIRSLRKKRGQPIQYPYGKLMTCPVCGRPLQRVCLDRVGSPAVWHCPPIDENGKPLGNTDCCGAYVHETDIDAALRKAFAELDLETVSAERKDSAELETAISMKRRMPELGEIHYYFLHEMVESMEFDTWDTLVIEWKCGTENRVPMEYSSKFRIPGGKEQQKNIVCKKWVRQATENTVEIVTAETADTTRELKEA